MTSPRRRIGIVAVCALALGLMGASPAGAQDDAPEDAPVDTLSAGDVMVLDFPELEVVISLPGGDAATVGPDSFTILEGDEVIVPSVITLTGGDLDVVLAIDTSGSMAGTAIESARSAAGEFASQLPDTARVGVVGFGPSPTVASALTADRTALGTALSGLTAGGETALHDAVIAASTLVSDQTDTRTALVILSDGGDTVSLASLDDAAATAAARFDVVHAVSLATGEQDSAALGSLLSGGGVVVQADDPVALAGVYRNVADRLINQYALRWDSTVVEDADITVQFVGESETLVAARSVDLDDDLVAELAAPPEPAPTTPAAVATTPPATVAIVTQPVPVTPSATMSGWVLWVGLALVAAALFIAGSVAALPVERRRNLAAEFRQRVPRGRELTGAGRRIVAAVEQLMRRDPDRQVGIALRLERAGMEVTPAEYGAVVVTGLAIAALFGFALLGLAGILVFPLIWLGVSLGYVDYKGKQRSNLFTSQLDATLQLISGSLRSGFGVMQALGTVAEESEWPTTDEFSRVLGEVRLGRDLTAALEASARRINTPDYHWAVGAISISNEVGGNLAEVLGNVSQTIRQRNTLRRQVQSLSAEGRVSAVILLALPPVMFLWMSITNSEYVGLLFSRTGGNVALLVGALMIITGGFWMRKIVRIPF